MQENRWKTQAQNDYWRMSWPKSCVIILALIKVNLYAFKFGTLWNKFITVLKLWRKSRAPHWSVPLYHLQSNVYFLLHMHKQNLTDMTLVPFDMICKTIPLYPSSINWIINIMINSSLVKKNIKFTHNYLLLTGT